MWPSKTANESGEGRFGLAAESPWQRATLKTQTYGDLRRLLMAGRFTPGEQLTVRLLAEQLGSTIMPVREAVQRLVAEGALVNLPSGRVHVPKLTRDEFRELMEIRQLLEPAACRHAAERATTAVIEVIKAQEETLSDALMRGVSDGVRSSNLNFHFAIYDAAESRHLVHLIESVWLRIGPMILSPTADDVPSGAYFGRELALHKELVRALWRRDGHNAAVIMRKILSATEEFYDQHFRFAL